MQSVFTKRFGVAGHEVGPGGEARPSTLLDYLQEVAGEHAATWKLAVTDLLPLGRTWVLSRYHLEFHRYPRFPEEVTVTTWPSSRTSTYATRDFTVDDGDGRPLVRATSAWAMLDLATKKPMRLDDVVPAEYAIDRRALEVEFQRLPSLAEVDREVRMPVMLRDLDVNVHVNHVVYVQWALETIPVPVLMSHRLATLEVAYRAEAHHGDTIASRRGPTIVTEGGDMSFVHAIVQAETGAELTRLRTTWAARSKPLAL
jgi:acyl-ACP thioesterase